MELAAQETVNPAALHYANRLSDHLFVMARAANDDGMGDVLWVPGEEPMNLDADCRFAGARRACGR